MLQDVVEEGTHCGNKIFHSGMEEQKELANFGCALTFVEVI
jgi:hypothetical protein